MGEGVRWCGGVGVWVGGKEEGGINFFKIIQYHWQCQL